MNQFKKEGFMVCDWKFFSKGKKVNFEVFLLRLKNHLKKDPQNEMEVQCTKATLK